jgi:parvulin-like peptidyl-prolyl isomerase
MPTTVNGETLDQELINQEFSQIKSWHEQQSQVSCCERDDEFLAQAKENVIGRVLLSQNAQTAVTDLSDLEIDQAIEQLKKDYGGEAQFFAQAGVGPNEMDMVRQQVNQNGKVDKLVKQVSQSVDAVSDETLKAFYESHIDLYTSEPRVQAMHIYKSLRQTEDKEALFQACCKKREQLVSGSDFIEIAKDFSDKPEEEIDLGWFKRGELMDEFEFVTFSMKVDEISPVFSSYHGFHIAKVTDTDPAKAQPFDEVKKKVLEDHQLDCQNAELKTYIEKLRKSALIQETPDENTDESSTETT